MTIADTTNNPKKKKNLYNTKPRIANKYYKNNIYNTKLFLNLSLIGIHNVMGLGKQLVLKWVVPGNINPFLKKITTKFAYTNLDGVAMTIF